MSVQSILLASSNPGKLRELRELCAGLSCEILAPEEFDFDLPEVVEDGETFFDNALKKAFSAAEAAAAAGETETWALADDSGLVIDFLEGRPGVRSARYAGIGESREERDAHNLAKVLREMQGVPESERQARFACVIAVARGDELLFAVDGQVEGRITDAPDGEGGFGYDSIFYHVESGSTFARLEPEAKNAISHRGLAVLRLRQVLESVLR